MYNSARLARLSAVAGLRTLLTEQARQELAARQDACDAARTKADEIAHRRDEGLADWRARLGRGAADLEVVSLASAWLIRLETNLAHARLDSDIHVQQAESASDRLKLARAHEEAVKKVRTNVHKALEKKRERRQGEQLADMVLRGRSRCLSR